MKRFFEFIWAILFPVKKICSTCKFAREDYFKNHYHCKCKCSKEDIREFGNRNRILLADFTDEDYFPCKFHNKIEK